MDTDENSRVPYLPPNPDQYPDQEPVLSRWPTPDPSLSGLPETDTSRSASNTRKPGRDGTPTVISSLGDVKKPDPEQAAVLVAGLLGLVVAGVAFVVRKRTRRKLRQPTRRQTKDIAEPLSRIMLRHADLTMLNVDLTDLIAAGAATGVYLNDGDLLEGSAIDPGMPEGLNQEATS